MVVEHCRRALQALLRREAKLRLGRLRLVQSNFWKVKGARLDSLISFQAWAASEVKDRKVSRSPCSRKQAIILIGPIVHPAPGTPVKF